MADPGFSPGGAPTPKVGTRIYFFGRKLHENERILAPRGGASLAPPLRSATEGHIPLKRYADHILLATSIPEPMNIYLKDLCKNAWCPPVDHGQDFP